MPKIISAAITAFTALILFAKSHSAQAIAILQDLDNPDDLSCFVVLISNIKNYALMIAGPITVLMIIIGGVMITVSGGQENLRAQGKKTLTGGIIGLIIVLLAWVIVSGVLMAIYGTDIVGLWEVKVSCSSN
jgi:hypothetical protein